MHGVSLISLCTSHPEQAGHLSNGFFPSKDTVSQNHLDPAQTFAPDFFSAKTAKRSRSPLASRNGLINWRSHTWRTRPTASKQPDPSASFLLLLPSRCSSYSDGKKWEKQRSRLGLFAEFFDKNLHASCGTDFGCFSAARLMCAVLLFQDGEINRLLRALGSAD